MRGNPAHFEAIGNRLGFRIETDTPQQITLTWRGARFPAFLCLGIAIALLFLSVPIVEAIRARGFTGSAASLWYFPVMNLILLGIAIFLVSLRRKILFDHVERRIALHKRSILRTNTLELSYDEVAAFSVGVDQVYSGFAVAGSSADQKYPVPSLRLVLRDGQTALLDRGGARRLEDLARRLSTLLEKPLTTEAAKPSK